MSRIAISLLSYLLISNLAFASQDEATAMVKQRPPTSTENTSGFTPVQLSARGPGALFESIDEAAIDALTYAYLQARSACEPEFMRGGTIHPVGDGYYSYGESSRADRLSLNRVQYILEPRDVARYHLYPVSRDPAINRTNERSSRTDRRSVSVVDPLHRPLYILHPSLQIRVYRGVDPQTVEVANLRRPKRPALFAAKCSDDAPSLGKLKRSERVAETSPAPHF
jgi:hypothetical protein